MPWMTFAKAPSILTNSGWDYPDGYFPRRFHYRADAKAAADEAARKGGTNITVVPYKAQDKAQDK
jgi:hypothetical protein